MPNTEAVTVDSATGTSIDIILVVLIVMFAVAGVPKSPVTVLRAYTASV